MTTRETILTALKKQGETRADDLAEPLGLTAMAVRQHLYQLQEEGAVTSIRKVVGRGRPAKLWKLTPKSDIYFQDAHRDLSLDLIDSIRSVMGEKALADLVSHRAKKQLAQYRAVTSDGDSTEEKLKLLAAERSREGYMAELSKADDGSLLFLENHCPICEAAKSCKGLCAKELAVFQDLFKETATVAREEHMLAGARRCSYSFREKDRAGPDS